MKRTERRHLVDADDGEISGQAPHSKRARSDISPPPASTRSSMSSHNNPENASKGKIDLGSSTVNKQNYLPMAHHIPCPRAQSDPPKRSPPIVSVHRGVTPSISELSDKAAKLHQKQREHMVNAERLQQRLTAGEHALGEHLRESLKIQRAIQQRREQNRADQQQLNRERLSVKSAADELDRVLRDMQALAQQNRV